MKESKQITLGPSEATSAAPEDFKYSMRGKVISITYLDSASIHEEIGRIMLRIEHWHQGSVKSYRILYQNAEGLGGEVKWDGENAKVIPPVRRMSPFGSGPFSPLTAMHCIGMQRRQGRPTPGQLPRF